MSSGFFITPVVEGEKPGLGSHAREAGAAAVPALPCLFSNNCNEDRVKLTGYQKKRAESIQQNVGAFIEAVGVERVGMLTLTVDPKRYPKGLSMQEALKMFHSLATGFLGEHFGEWMRVGEFQKNGMPHFHLAIETKEDIRTGFDFDYLKRVQEWQKGGCKGPKPKGDLNRSDALRTLHKRINAGAPKYGFGRCELTPVRCADKFPWYLGGYMSKSLANRPSSAKGTRFVGYSSGFKRRVKGLFSWNTPAGWVYRQKLGTFLAERGFLGMDWQEAMRCYGGRYWAYKLREAILDVHLSYWPTLAHWEADRTAPVGLESAFCSEMQLKDLSSISYQRAGEVDWHSVARGVVHLADPVAGSGRVYKLRQCQPTAVARWRVLHQVFKVPEGQADLPFREKNRANLNGCSRGQKALVSYREISARH
jgi:hypothetical protein